MFTHQLQNQVTLQPSTPWRIAAALLWIVSIACLFKAVSDGTAAEKWLYNPHLSDGAKVSIQHLQAAADRWAVIGWVLQLATAAVLSAGINSKRVVRRIFVALGVLVAADGISLLLMAVIVR
jgi:hypothetical protein